MTTTADRLRALTLRLNERLVEAQGIRARLTSARESNLWPDLRRMSLLRSRRFTDIPDPRFFVRNPRLH
jgi:hypothetical protein